MWWAGVQGNMENNHYPYSLVKFCRFPISLGSVPENELLSMRLQSVQKTALKNLVIICINILRICWVSCNLQVHKILQVGKCCRNNSCKVVPREKAEEREKTRLSLGISDSFEVVHWYNCQPVLLYVLWIVKAKVTNVKMTYIRCKLPRFPRFASRDPCSWLSSRTLQMC